MARSPSMISITERDIGRIVYTDCSVFAARCWSWPKTDEGFYVVSNTLRDGEPLVVLDVPQEYTSSHVSYSFANSSYRMVKVLTQFGIRYMYCNSLRLDQSVAPST